MPPPESPSIRLAELMAALSTASDYAMGQPVEYALESCLVAMRLGEAYGMSAAERHDVYYQALLRFIGCNADTYVMAAVVGDEIALRTEFAAVDAANQPAVLRLALRFIRDANPGVSPLELMGAVGRGLLALGGLDAEVFPGHCEVAQRLGTRLGFSPGFVHGLGQLYARWDGKGVPAIKGEAITPAVRIVTLAQDAVTFRRLGGLDAALRVVRERRGKQYDPRIADLFLAQAGRWFDALALAPRWAGVLALEPEPHAQLAGERLDEVLQVLADYADIKSPWTLRHSGDVAELTATACTLAGLPPETVVEARRSALVHDIGRVGISAGIWGKPGALSESEWDKVRQHSYLTDRILARVPSLGRLARLASSAHEREDGQGYFRGLSGHEVPLAARILASADVYAALVDDRPHRPAFSPEQAAALLGDEAANGRLDSVAVNAVLQAAGHPSTDNRRPHRDWPAGLSDREVEVLGQLARGHSNKDIARRLGVSPKTVDNQLQSIYAKAGVKTRAGATLFAMENRLVPVG